jgi:hypothetical protein
VRCALFELVSAGVEIAVHLQYPMMSSEVGVLSVNVGHWCTLFLKEAYGAGVCGSA